MLLSSLVCRHTTNKYSLCRTWLPLVALCTKQATVSDANCFVIDMLFRSHAAGTGEGREPQRQQPIPHSYQQTVSVMMHTSVHVCACVCVCVRACVFACVRACVFACVRACVHAWRECMCVL